MNWSLGQLLPPAVGRGRSWLAGIVLFLVVVLVAVHFFQVYRLRTDDEHWDAVAREQCEEDLQAAQGEFTNIQRTVRRTGTEVAQSRPIRDFLSGRSGDRIPLFEAVAKFSRDQTVGIEVYDRDTNLVAWEGQSGPRHSAELGAALGGQMASSVASSPISSQLSVVIPVWDGGLVLGAVLLRRTIEVNFPLSTRYVSREGIGEQLRRDIGETVEFSFGPASPLRADSRFVSAPLYNIDSTRAGTVSVRQPARATFLERVNGDFQQVNAVILFLLFGILFWIAGRQIMGARSTLVRCVGMTAVLWLARFALLWLEIPSSFVGGGIFDPAGYASKFGSGLAKSSGEMLLSIMTLAINEALVFRIIGREGGSLTKWWSAKPLVLRIGASIVSTFLLFWVLRGYAAVIRSAVFDSTLQFADPRSLLPSFELGFMLFSLSLLTICMIVLAVGCTQFLLSLYARGESAGRGSWTTVAVLYLVAAVLFGLLQETPLMSTAYRCLFGAGALVIVALWRWQLTRTGGPSAVRGAQSLTAGKILMALGLTALVMYPLLELNTHEKNAAQMETYAEEVLRPVDNWLKFVVEDALQGFQADTTVADLLMNPTAGIDRVAFSRWAQSVACREGYASIFAVADSDGQEVSRFTIGSQAGLALQIDSSMVLATHKTTRVQQIGNGLNAVKVYSGSVPITLPDGQTLGYGRVIITAGQQTLFRGDAPTILRGLSQDGLDWLSSHVTISEFRNGLMLMSGTNSFPIGYSLPERVKSAFDDPGRTSLWADETIDGTRYETYYARRAGGTGEIVALSLPDLGFRRYLMGVVRLLVFFSLVLLIVVALLPLRWLRGRHRRLTFRDRLLVALLVTACVPLALLILYGRLTAAQRLFDRTSQSLDDQTWSVATSLKDQMESTGRDDIYSVRPAVAEAIATDLGTDFNLYAGDDLMLSTRPELYEIGILDRRISGSAFAGVALRGRRFHVERENIGQYDYIVGYRPVLDNAGGIIGIVSVPTLYRQDDVEEELTLRNAILFGMYALVFISILIIATVFANRIASPIQRLTEATRSVAAGDLDVRLNMPAVDGEIGDLVSSFDRMTKDLRRSREELVRFERDLAWKEMAKQVAHEIKNPLTPMKLAVQHLRQTYKDRVTDFDEVMTTVTKTIIEQIDTLSRIASEFSHFARMPKRQLEHCDVNEVVQESVRLFDQHAGIRFNLVTTPALPPVVADREELRRAFINIIRNGIQAMDGSGTIGIRTDHVPEGVRIEIADAGGGIPDEVRAKLFQPNFSTKTDGMGLGLAIVKQTVDDLAGTIAIESASGAGTRVTIILPPAEG